MTTDKIGINCYEFVFPHDVRRGLLKPQIGPARAIGARRRITLDKHLYVASTRCVTDRDWIRQDARINVAAVLCLRTRPSR